MQKSKWKAYVPFAIVALLFTGVGWIGKASADGSLPSYVGCSLPK